MGRSIDGMAMKKLRESRGLTQDALAMRVGISKRTILRMENGESVTRTSIRRIAAALGVTESSFDGSGMVTEVPIAAPASWPVGSRQHRLRHYLRTLSEQLGRITPIVAEHSREERPLRLADLYVPPCLTEREIGPDAESDLLAKAGLPALEWLANHPRVALLAPGGMGKSTVAAWLADRLAAPEPNEVRAKLGDLLPVPLILRDFRGAPDKPKWSDLVQAFRESRLGDNLTDSDWAEVEKALEAGEAFVFFDGLDEVGTGARRQGFVNALWEGVDRYPKARWLAASRIVGYGEAEVDPTLPEPTAPDRVADGLDEASFRRLYARTEAKRIRDFARCWLAPFDDARIAAFAENWYELREEADIATSRAEDLAAAVRRHRHTLQLARVPYFLSLIAVVHREYATLPSGRIELYKRIVGGCCSAIPRRKQMEILPYQELHLLAWLGEVGFAMQRARGKQDGLVPLSGAEIRKTISEAAKRRGTALHDDDLDRMVDFLKYRAGLLVEASPGEFRFSHLLLQEFFAAWHLGNLVEQRAWWADEHASFTKDDLRSWADSPHWAEALCLLFERLASASDPKLSDDVARIAFPGLSDLFDELEKRTPGEEGRVEPSPRFLKLGEAAIRLLHDLAKDDGVRWFQPGARQSIRAAVTLWRVEQRRGDVPLAKLARLDLRGTGVCDATPLGRLANLRKLNLGGTGVSDATPLGRLANLTWLVLSDTGVSDAMPLGGLAKLEALDLGRTGVSDATPLGGLANLKELDLGRTGVSDATPLGGLAKLWYLDLSGTGVSDATPLGGLANLTRLDLSDTGVSDATPLGGLANLEDLDLSGTGVSDATPLGGLANLRELNLCGTGVRDVTPLGRLANLEVLHLSDTGVSDANLAALKRARPTLYVVT